MPFAEARGYLTDEDVFHAVLAEHQLIIGEAVLAELRRVLRQQLRVSADTIAEMDTFLCRQASVVTEASPLRIKLRDPDDLVVLPARAPLPIVTPRGLWEILRASPGAK